jgi:hypothetical protein
VSIRIKGTDMCWGWKSSRAVMVMVVMVVVMMVMMVMMVPTLSLTLVGVLPVEAGATTTTTTQEACTSLPVLFWREHRYERTSASFWWDCWREATRYRASAFAA